MKRSSTLKQNEECEYDYLFKMIMLGDSGVGKTNILSRFAKNEFSFETKPTIGVEFSVKNLLINDKIVKMQLWDTAGQERYRAITKAYYKGSIGAIVVFDLTRKQTFENTAKWFEELQANGEPNVIKLLVGNKNDLVNERQVTKEAAIEFAKEFSAGYIETSALTINNIQDTFEKIGQCIYIKKMKKLIEILKQHGKVLVEQQGVPTGEKIVFSNPDKKEEKSSCC